MNSNAFSHRGTLIGIGLLLFQYLVNISVPLYITSDWEGNATLRYDLYITLLTGIIIAVLLVNRKEDLKEVIENIGKVDDFKVTVLKSIGLSIFYLGAFIVVNIAQNKFSNYAMLISEFATYNYYVSTASDVFSIANDITQPLITTFIFQGFILNGLAKKIEFKEANILVALLYGYWFNSFIGGAVYCLFLNKIYWNTRNIFYPVILNVIINILFALAYLVKEDFWFLQQEYSDHYKDLVKGTFMVIVSSPLVYQVIKQTIASK